MNVRDEAKKLINQVEGCVVSSIGPKGEPQSAFVGFSMNDKFEVVIGTSMKSRKFRNILNDPRVSIVFGPYEKLEVQYEGEARQLEGMDREKRKADYLRVKPGASKYEDDPDQTYLLVKPKWLRLAHAGPENLGEMEFGS